MKPKSNSKPKLELMLATWPRRADETYFGDRWGDWRGLDDCLSCKLRMRMVDRADKYAYMNEASKAIADIGVYVWVSRDGTVSLDLRLFDIHSMELQEVEARAKALKAMFAKAAKGGYPLGRWTFVKTRDVHAELCKLFDALGIRFTIEYHGIGQDETYAPVGVALRRIADDIEKQVVRQGGWKEPQPQVEEAA